METGEKMDYLVITDEISLLIEQQTRVTGSNIVDQLIAKRKEFHLTQQDIANATGMKRANVTRIEAKKYTPSLEVLNRYADCMGLKLNITLEKK
jgi:DNA-binding XRE family transcriptional regulator